MNIITSIPLAGTQPGIVSSDTTSATFPPQQHFNYDEIKDKCHCVLCTEVGHRLQFWEDNRFTQHWHPDDCRCQNCNEARSAYWAYRAAQGKQIIYSEMSYNVQQHRQAAPFLKWLYNQMTESGTDYWWAVTAMSRTCASWLLEWQKECLPRAIWAVSGFVWYDSDIRRRSRSM